MGDALAPSLCPAFTTSQPAPALLSCRHKEDVYENLQSKNKKEDKVKKQRSADKEKGKGSLKRK